MIALDGDEMGKRINGARLPELAGQVAKVARQYLESKNGLIPEGLPRALTPSYHMQFSEALANFATYLTDPIVNSYGGQLVYSGGDDVLAIVPADNALHCIRALRAAFRGCAEDLPPHREKFELDITQRGFVLANEEYPLIVPGPAAEVSVGIAFAHYQHPLQAIVRAAQTAEKRAKVEFAKGGYDRGAFAVSLIKLGGETVHWGAKWEWPALAVYDQYREFRKKFVETKKSCADAASGRFPYALAGLLVPYRLEDQDNAYAGFDPRPVIERELETVFENQGGGNLREGCQEYLKKLEDSGRLHDFANLFLTAAFIERDRGDRQ